MLYVEPDFYSDFHCIAGSCQHSCCKGWEIDIDEATAELYSQLPGELGQELRRKICLEPEPHFCLTEDESCPFLNEQGLCRLILGFGEDVLCDICREHPRFYNDFDQRQESGLGLCCEEATRLLLERENPLELVYYADEDGEREEPKLIAVRRQLMDILSNLEAPMEQRINAACNLLGLSNISFDAGYWRDAFLKLERMDGEWTRALMSIKAEPVILCGDTAHTRLVQYMLYRNLSGAEDIKALQGRGQLCFISLYLICAMEQSGGELKELVRLWSAELEYSDENIYAILEKL